MVVTISINGCVADQSDIICRVLNHLAEKEK